VVLDLARICPNFIFVAYYIDRLTNEETEERHEENLRRVARILPINLVFHDHTVVRWISDQPLD
jgi:hypothetical protein